MKGFGIAIAACLLAGCAKEEPAQPKVEPPKTASTRPADPPEAVLDEKAQRDAGIVTEQVRERSVPLLVSTAGQTGVNELRSAPGGEGADLSRIWIVAEPDEKSISRARIGMPAEVFVEAWPGEPFPGVVTRVEGGRIRIEVPNKDLRLKPGSEATVEIEVGASTPGLYVPEDEPQKVDGKTVLFVQKIPGHFEIRPVTVGRKVEGYLEVTSGLKPGEILVVEGSEALKTLAVKPTVRPER